MTYGNQLGRGNGTNRHPGDSSFPRELFFAVLECDGLETDAHLTALQALADGMEGSIHIAEVNSTCLAIGVNVPAAALPRLKAGLQLGGATIMPQTAGAEDRLVVVLGVRPGNKESSSQCKSD